MGDRGRRGAEVVEKGARDVKHRAKRVSRFAVHPLVDAYRQQQEMARNKNPRITLEQQRVVAWLAMVVVALTLLSLGMALTKYAGLSPEDFQAYHPGIGWAGLASGLLGLLTLGMMDVKLNQWVAYVFPFKAAVASLLFLVLYYGVVDPSSVSFLDRGPAWWRG